MNNPLRNYTWRSPPGIPPPPPSGRAHPLTMINPCASRRPEPAAARSHRADPAAGPAGLVPGEAKPPLEARA